MTIKEAVVTLLNGENLSALDIEEVVLQVMRGETSDILISAFLVLLRQKGETSEEIIGAVKAVRSQSTKIQLDENSVDTCGTGGDGAGTFNISTASALIAAAAGVKIAKHGNRSASSRCGSADVLESIGFKIDLDSDKTKALFEQTGFAFLYAPVYHKSMKAVAPVRKELGLRTIFNVIGPMCNPAGVLRQVIGVYDKGLTGIFAQVLRQLGSEHCLIIHGLTAEGVTLDEPSICGATVISELKGGLVTNYTVFPEDFGLKRWQLSDIEGGDLKQNAQIIWHLAENQVSDAIKEAALLSAGMSIYISGKTDSIKDGIDIARDVIESGKMKTFLRETLVATQNLSSSVQT
ncbi:MAG: anthranilate phosphoribosyltransferase [Chloroherpetonaceae bacterium]|nr:anthranilate phosphoribosyltransferase [Chloroherpetonaceae bacterium]